MVVAAVSSYVDGVPLSLSHSSKFFAKSASISKDIARVIQAAVGNLLLQLTDYVLVLKKRMIEDILVETLTDDPISFDHSPIWRLKLRLD